MHSSVNAKSWVFVPICGVAYYLHTVADMDVDKIVLEKSKSALGILLKQWAMSHIVQCAEIPEIDPEYSAANEIMKGTTGTLSAC
jgi:hypothetical protein